MIQPMTMLEVYSFVCENTNGECGLDTNDKIMSFIVSHMMNDMIFVSRAEDGKIRGVMFAWPLTKEMAEGNYDGEPPAIASGPYLYINFLVVSDDLSEEDGMEAVLSMKDRVSEKHNGRIKFICYHRHKYKDKYKIVPFSEGLLDG